MTELRPLLAARTRRFDRSARGTQQFLGRAAQSPQSPGRGNWSGDFDPEELFGAAWWLTPREKECGAADERESKRFGCNDQEEPSTLPRGFFVT
jgi:hypothetical protein